MPVARVELVGKQDAAMKKELMNYIIEQISTVSNTPVQNIYVFINEWDEENVCRKDPVITLDWVAKPERDAAIKAEIMRNIVNKVEELTGIDKSGIPFLITDLPPDSVSVGGVARGCSQPK
ncbi:MAG: tautomerase family protein [Anaerotignum sp.]|nr:tautomerase family protein [Anaerotignum sp.]MBR6542010.1 tautomerase family protein [Anaerotignum sp.]